MSEPTQTHDARDPSGERQSNRALRIAPVVTRRALEKSGFPECLDREIEELDRTEKRLAHRFPDLFG